MRLSIPSVTALIPLVGVLQYVPVANAWGAVGSLLYCLFLEYMFN